MPDTSHPIPVPSAAASHSVTNPGPSVEAAPSESRGVGLPDPEDAAVSEPISAATTRILAAIARRAAHTASHDHPA